MSTKTTEQMELAIVADGTKEKEDDAKTEKEDEIEIAPCTVCGSEMVSVTFSEDIKRVCSCCFFEFHEGMKQKQYYHCPKEANHKRKLFALCVTCAKAMAKFKKQPVNEIHDTEKLYFLYNRSKISGPLTKNEVISLFVKKQLKEDKLYLMDAADDDDWIKLDLNNVFFTNYNMLTRDEERFQRIQKIESVNAEFKSKYPEIYTGIVENYLRGTLRQIRYPASIPDGEEKASSFQGILTNIGRCLAILILGILLLHCLATGIVALCTVGVLYCIMSFSCDIDVYWFQFFGFIITYLGMIVTPATIVYLLIAQTDEWKEIQSWMLAYILWGFGVYAVAISYVIFGVLLDRGYSTINKLITFIIGVDFGSFDVFEEVEDDDTGPQSAVIFIFPALACLLPAAIAGFIANYAFEEKFELKCSSDVTNDYLCFADKYGCCEIVSSHDAANAYTFIGGLASNIIAAWAVIRLCGYLVANAWDHFKFFVRRVK